MLQVILVIIFGQIKTVTDAMLFGCGSGNADSEGIFDYAGSYNLTFVDTKVLITSLPLI